MGEGGGGDRTKVLMLAASAVLWPVSWHLNAMFFASAAYTTGISLVYFPAGVRLAIVLLFGIWGAIGIAVSNPFLFLSTFGEQGPGEIVVNSLIAGFVPLLVARGVQRALGVDHSLSNLRPLHLPLLALAVSIATPLALNLQFAAQGLKPVGEMWSNMSAMMLGDFLGCMVALVAVRLLIPVWRRIAPPRM